MVAVLLFFLSAALIYGACEYFVNGVEWAGRKANLGETATGSVLAAFGTALPESAVTLVAVLAGTTQGADIGVGAALGGPLVLATISYAVVGFMMARHGKHKTVQADCKSLRRDQALFLAIFACKLALGLVTFLYKPWLGLCFVVAYAAYVRSEIRRAPAEEEKEETLEPLYFARKKEYPPTTLVWLQTGLSLVVIAVASHVFVGQVEAIGEWLNMPAQLVALLLSPVATELPETMNAIIWVRQGKERLALANISGAMMIQATIPSALGIFFTPWLLSPPLLISGLTTVLAIALLLFYFCKREVRPRQLMGVAWCYVAFLAWVLCHGA